MARIPRDAKIETREARGRLDHSGEIHWRQIHPGAFVGYRKNKSGGTWWARAYEQGKYRKRRLGPADDYLDADGGNCLSYKGAIGAALAWINSTNLSTAPGPSYTVADGIDDYLQWFRLNGKSLRDTTYAINAHILPKLGKLKVIDLRAETLNRWLIGLTREPLRNRGTRVAVDSNDVDAVRRRKASANRVLTVLKAALNHAYREGKAPSDDAWRRVKPFRSVDAAKVRFLSVPEAQRLLTACEPHFRDLVRGALLTGCRYGELVKMIVDDYTAVVGTIQVRDPKSRRSRHVPLTEEGQEWFHRWTVGKRGDQPIFTRDDGLPWSRAHQTRRMKDACSRACIVPAVSFHELRHTYASFLALAGVSDQVIAAALGHADTRMTVKHYAHLKPSYVADTLRAHLPNLGGTGV